MTKEKLPRIEGPLSKDSYEFKRKMEQIDQLEKPLENLLSQLKEKIENGEYEVLIGEDASGRMPTPILGSVIKEIYKKNGLPPPIIRFVAGSASLDAKNQPHKRKRELIDAYVESLVKDLRISKRILLITDTIVTGKSLKPLVDALEKNKVSFDIATVGIPTRMVGVKDVEEALGKKIYYGSEGQPHIKNRSPSRRYKRS